MNKFKCCGTLKEFDVKYGGYTSKLWLDGKKTDKDIDIKTIRGSFTVEINGEIMTFKIEAQDRSLFAKTEKLENGKPPIQKSYTNIKSFCEKYEEGGISKIRFTGKATDDPYYSPVKGEVIEAMSFVAEFINVANENEEDEFFLNAVTYIYKYEEIEGTDDYRVLAYISPGFGKKYFPIRSSKNDKCIYITRDNMEVILENCSEDGEKITNSMIATYRVKFVNRGTKSKGKAKSFGSYEEITSGWTETQLWIDGGRFEAPIYVEKEIDDEIVSVCTNANMVIERKDYMAAKKERPDKLAGVKTKYEEYQAKKGQASKKTDDLDDLDDI